MLINQLMKRLNIARFGKNRLNRNIKHIDSQVMLKAKGEQLLQGLDAILVPGDFGERGIEGKMPRLNTPVKIKFLTVSVKFV